MTNARKGNDFLCKLKKVDFAGDNLMWTAGRSLDSVFIRKSVAASCTILYFKISGFSG